MSESAGPASPAEWYGDGLRFECTSCGNCCTGPPGYVWFTPAEGRRIASAMDLTEDEFLGQYTRKAGSGRSLAEVETEHGFDCIFLDRDSIPGKAICSIYEFRPAQCRSWPFWPENIRSKRAWLTTKRTTPCPGMDSGQLISIEEIRLRSRPPSEGEQNASTG